MAGLWDSARKFLYRRILHADDTPHRIALGVALATFVAFTPTVGIQTILALGVAALFRANKAVCIPIVWITNPVTMGPIYGACWWLGKLLTPGSTTGDFAAMEHRLRETAASDAGWWSQIFSYEFWAGIFHLMLDMGTELWIGCLVVGVFFGLLLYFLSYYGIVGYRRRKSHRLEHRLERRRRRLAKAKKQLVSTSPDSV